MSRGFGKLEQKIIKYLSQGTYKFNDCESIHKKLKPAMYAPKSSSVKQIVDYTKAPYQSVTRSIRKLEKKGVIRSRIANRHDILRDPLIGPEYRDMVIEETGLGKNSKWCKTICLSKKSINLLKRSPNADKYIFNLTEFIENLKKEYEK